VAHTDRTSAVPRDVPYRGRRERWPAARVALTAFFCLDGLLFAGWVVRIPAVKAQVHASPGALGLALLCLSAGAVAAMRPTGRLCVRWGNVRVTLASAVLLSLAVALPAQCHTVVALGAALFVFGIGYGALNVGMNSAAVDQVAASPGLQMPSFHAAYSLGGLLGSALGGLAAPYLSPAVHLALAALLGLVATGCAGTALARHPVPVAAPVRAAGADPRGAGARHLGLLVVLLGVVALCDAYGEGALADWATLHLTADLRTTSAVAAVGFAVYSCAMTLGRLGGTWALSRFGPARLLVRGAALAAAGMLVAALSPLLPLVLLGFLLVGLGLANIFPIAIARAGELTGPQGVATASTFGYGGMVLGPPVIGFLAQYAGLPTALTSVALLAALSGAAALLVQRVARRAERG
jgi:MFS family permease